WLGQLNTLPGFTSASMYPRLLEVAGLPLGALVDRLVDLGVERHRSRAGRRGHREPRAGS
ncbi:MAG: D-alanine--D-alanine ligase A, partial [Chloroflexi bacterium]|nr:D-alanine--D-alanine ligase A [Chloroflexota bacterium]